MNTPEPVIVETAEQAAQRADEAERQRDSLARGLLFELGRRALNEAAIAEHPNDLYAQTVVVMGYDPLERIARQLTAERFSR